MDPISLLPWIFLPLTFLAQKNASKNSSVPKAFLSIVAGLALADACALAIHPLLGLGLALVIVGHELRLPFIAKVGSLGYGWFEPLVVFPGLALAGYGAAQAGGWQAWAFFAFALFNAFNASMGMFMGLKARAKLRGGYGVEPGKAAPDFNLPDESGFPVALGSFKDRSHVLLIFVRGDWCPSCHITLRTYARNKDRFQAKNVVLLAVGPDPVGVNQRMVKDLGVPYKMLSDEGQRTAMAYGVQMDDEFSKKVLKEGVPLPASFLVDKSGVVRYTSRPEKAGEFLDPATIFPALQGLAA